MIIFNFKQYVKSGIELEKTSMEMEEHIKKNGITTATNFDPAKFNAKLYKKYIDILEINQYFQEQCGIDPFKSFQIRQRIRSKILTKKIKQEQKNETGRYCKIIISWIRGIIFAFRAIRYN